MWRTHTHSAGVLGLGSLLAMLLLLGACGGGGGGGGGGGASGPVVLFFEGFDGAWPTSDWSPTNLADVGIISGVGELTPPCLQLAGGAGARPVVTANVQPWPAAGGVIILDAEGTRMGAVGISGDSSANDEAAAFAGIDAAELSYRT